MEGLHGAFSTRHLPDGYTRWQYFICGPDAMMDAAEAALIGLGVPAQRVHTERYDMALARHPVHHTLTTRLVCLIAVLIVIACVMFAAAQS